ncbi:hypothetical protein H2204_005650 [Knufia peltigerae]|uniref:BZIP domain-containing protein n=1 Tax=Knufia peltigerae TaxID=1002370 RepID=A0AA38Y518_9EURO|nr:hypothetical protein H2204_005650 [Knufia peltigerae]
MEDPAAQVSGSTVEVDMATGTNSGRRKGKTTPMDAAKLMRKRATDRRSQQAFRERTKLRITALEDEVAKSSRATEAVTQELHELTLQRDNLRTECIEWKEKARETSKLQAQLHNLANKLDQIRARGSDQDPEAFSTRQPMLTGASMALSTSSGDSNQDRTTDDYPNVQSQTRDDQGTSVEVHSTTALLPLDVLSLSKEARGSSYETSRFAREACAVVSPQPLCRSRCASYPTDSADYESGCIPMSTGQTSPRHGAAEILQLISKDPLSMELSELYTGAGLCTHCGVTGLTEDVSIGDSAQEPRPYASPEIQFQQLQADSPACWQGGQSPTSSNQFDLCEQLPYNLKPVVPGDRILQSLVASRRSAAAEGVPWDELLGPELPCWKSLIAPTLTSCGHTICQAVFDIVKAYTGYSGIPEKVASAYIMYTSVTVGQSMNAIPPQPKI